MSLREYFSLKKDHMKIRSKPEKSLNTMVGRHDNVDYIIFCFIQGVLIRCDKKWKYSLYTSC